MRHINLVFALLILSITASVGQNEFESLKSRFGTLYAKAVDNDETAIKGMEGWYFLPAELRHIGVGEFWGSRAAEVSQAKNKDYADPLPAILDFQKRLKEQNIVLIMLPVPPKALVYPDMTTDNIDDYPVKGMNKIYDSFYMELRQKGINVVDLYQPLVDLRRSGKKAYCKTDSHWSGQACMLAADIVAAKIREHLELSNGLEGLTSSQHTIDIAGDLVADNHEKEQLTINEVNLNDGEVIAEDAEVLVLGDSHTLVFHAGGDMLARNAGFVDHLGFNLKSKIDLIGVRGSGATPARINLYRKSKADPNYLAKKKVVIWCFSAREFTESDGWRIVPLK